MHLLWISTLNASIRPHSQCFLQQLLAVKQESGPVIKERQLSVDVGQRVLIPSIKWSLDLRRAAKKIPGFVVSLSTNDTRWLLFKYIPPHLYNYFSILGGVSLGCGFTREKQCSEPNFTSPPYRYEDLSSVAGRLLTVQQRSKSCPEAPEIPGCLGFHYGVGSPLLWCKRCLPQPLKINWFGKDASHSSAPNAFLKK